MTYIILILLVGLNLAPFMFRGLDMWTAQGMFAQICVIVMFTFSFFIKPMQRIKNIPLGLLFGWISILAGMNVLRFLSDQRHTALYKFMYDSDIVVGEVRLYLTLFKQSILFVNSLAPYVNFLFIIILYKILTEHLNRDRIEKILVWLRYVAIGTLFLCVLQRFNLSQYFRLIKPSHVQNNLVVGLSGNGTHLSGYLASLAPLFLWKCKREDILALILLPILLLYTSESLNDPAISGYIVLSFVFFYFIKSSKMIIYLLPIALITLWLSYGLIPKAFWSNSGRLYMWEDYWKIFTQGNTGLGYGLIGVGMGAVNQLCVTTKVPTAHHLHLELWQFVFEMGIVCGVLILNVINNFINKVAKDRTELTVKCMFLGFVVSSFFTYPAHLWLPSIYAVFSYSAYLVLKGE